ncbi:MAG TPA: hypothetical protein VGQ05_09395 [Streptosporangiaceae bacterium]|jgi:hypothetical protein|nr:hypothetical protein [Streptosporangiaceae bacterium]
MRVIARSSGCAVALLLAGTAALAAPAAAQASIPGGTVVPCSSSALVTAIQRANSARFATLVLSRGCNYVLTMAAAPNDGLPPVTGNLVILGSGGTTISRSSSAGKFRIFDVPGRLVLANVTVANGNSGNEVGGGIIDDDGTLVLRNVRLTGNTAPSGGGLAVLNGGRATVSFSVLDGNNATGFTGGAIDINSGDLVVDHSRVTGNTAHLDGGGVATNSPSTTRITGTVVARNVAGRVGGGIVNGATMVLRGDRVVFNRAGSGGGGIFNDGTLSLLFTLVAFNSPDNCSPQGTIRGCRH